MLNNLAWSQEKSNLEILPPKPNLKDRSPGQNTDTTSGLLIILG